MWRVMQAHGELLAQLFSLFEQFVALHASICQFLEHLQAGGFIQCTLDTLLTVGSTPSWIWI